MKAFFLILATLSITFMILADIYAKPNVDLQKTEKNVIRMKRRVFPQCITTRGRLCKFPFRYDGKWHNGCVEAYGWDYWCEVYGGGWDYCTESRRGVLRVRGCAETTQPGYNGK